MKQEFKKSDSAFTTIIVAVVCLIHLVPFYLAANIALKPRTDLSSKWQPAANFQLDNFTNVWQEAHLSRTFVNNILITLGSVLLITIIGALAAYPLARYPSRLNRLVYLFCISIMVVPPLTILVSLYKLVVGLGGINQYWAIIAIETTFNLPLAIFMYTGFIRNLPRELDEAAIMDGCSRFGIFPRIIMPLLKPVTATVVIINSVFVWNDFQFALFFLQRPEVQTLSVVMSQFFSQYQSNLPWAAAGCLLGMVPVALLYLFLQKYFVSGLADGAVKG